MSEIKSNTSKILEEIDTAKVRVLAVSKYVGIEEILQAYDAGIRNLAENKLQDALRKKTDLPTELSNGITWHFIGHLQTNKVKDAVGNFEFIHSVDSLKIANCISKVAEAKNIIQKVLIQVNISQEPSKFGFTVEEVKQAFKEILNLSSLNIQGLMTIASNSDDKDVIRQNFIELRELRDFLQDKYGCQLPELSMGMSNDYKIAIKEGSTMIRIGNVLFK